MTDPNPAAASPWARLATWERARPGRSVRWVPTERGFVVLLQHEAGVTTAEELQLPDAVDAALRAFEAGASRP